MDLTFWRYLLPRLLIIAGAASYRWIGHQPLNSVIAGICFANAVGILESYRPTRQEGSEP